MSFQKKKKKKKKEILKTFLLFDCVCPFSKFCGHELSDMTNFEKFHGHNLSGKGLKTSKTTKISVRESFFP